MRIGIDLGGTKIEVIALDDEGQAILRKRVATPRDDYPGTVETIAALVEWVEQETGQRGSVGVGIPGTLSPYTGKVKNANSVWLNGQRLDQDLQTRLQRPVRMANDANCMAVSEATDGAGIGMNTIFAVIIGTGIALNGKVHSGGNGVAELLQITQAFQTLCWICSKTCVYVTRQPSVIILFQYFRNLFTSKLFALTFQALVFQARFTRLSKNSINIRY